ncbi:hypothetical protein MKW92_001220 [Papaver armeniacum]|nr:hypothetical protein MKW92_001220 [Papaver armeniacum]
MAETRGLIISCAFIYVLFASSTLICKAEGDECGYVVGETTTMGILRRVDVGNVVDARILCATTEGVCVTYCSLQPTTVGQLLIEGGKSGKCIYPKDDALGVGYCACCQAK